MTDGSKGNGIHDWIREYRRILWGLLIGVLTVAGLCILTQALLGGCWATPGPRQNYSAGLMDRYDKYMTNEISCALEGVFAVEPVYWLSDEDPVAPKPDPANYGQVDSTEELRGLLEDAEKLLGGQKTLFTPETPVWEKFPVSYYLDETLFTVVWKQILGGCVYTFAEVKIAHPSQLRRFLAGGEYGSDKQFITTEMARSVNAVLASSGDFYKYRRQGIIVSDGIVHRANGRSVDTCYIDEQGDLLFTRRGQIPDMETAQKFVDENHIRFSLSFGPILIDEGKRCEPDHYLLGEIRDHFPRAALCQMDELHYVLAVCNREAGYNTMPTIHAFAAQIQKLGCPKAYTLDGGQTCVIALNGELMNAVHYGSQRRISDIFYFGTALPGGGTE